MKKLILQVFCMLGLLQAHTQQINTDILQKKWNAYWITAPNASLHEYGVYHFRKTITLADKPSSFIVHVSGDNRYKLYVNGKLATFGPARGDIYHWNFETVDIAPFLTEGNNTLAAVVWNFGEERQEAQISWQTGFILQGNTEAEKIVNTNNTWKCFINKAYSPLQPLLVYSYYAAGPTERIDYHLYPTDWTGISFNDADWPKSTQISTGLPKGVFDFTLGWMLVPRPIPQMELKKENFATVKTNPGNYFTTDFLAGNASITIPANSNITVLLDWGKLTTAYPVVEFSKGKNADIQLTYAEALYLIENSKDWRAETQKGNRNEVEGKRLVGVTDELISNGNNQQRFESLMWRTYRYVKVTITTQEEPLTLNALYGIFEGYPFSLNASFTSNNPVLTDIFTTGWHTARLDAHETYMDCPYYEQLQYGGDTRIQALVSLYNSGDDRLMRNAIEQLRNSLMPEGITLSRFPTAHAQEIPTFSLIWISMLHDYWMYRGDSAFIQKQLPVARMILHYFEQYQQADGSLKKSPYWNFTDWVDDKGWNAGVAPIGKDGSSAALDLQLLMAYQSALGLETQNGLPDFIQRYTRKIEQLKNSIIINYWNSEKMMFSDTKEKQLYSQHCNSLAILTNTITGTKATLLAKKIITDTGISKATIYFRYYLHQAMAKAGLGNEYLNMLDKWKEDLAMGLTTWAEMDDVNRSRSDCHAWGSSPNIELLRIVLGIDAATPGFATVKIEPHLGNLTNASGNMPHPKGQIAVSYTKNTNGKWNCLIQLPETINGVFIWQGKSISLHAGSNKFIF
jgi:alpha-L-rhamnosidase